MRALWSPDDPESLLQNTITPSDLLRWWNGKDYLHAEHAFADIESKDMFFNADKALEYKAKAAMEELTAAGCDLPRDHRADLQERRPPTGRMSASWFKQQLEGVLGTDYINCRAVRRPLRVLPVRYPPCGRVQHDALQLGR